jgi:hypothetical protein
MMNSGDPIQRDSPCVSVPAPERSEAHALKCQVFTIPWGNPREPTERNSIGRLEARRRAEHIIRVRGPTYESNAIWRFAV